ncbi:four helix bundle protein [Candidatus Peregrinibacteria bacterium]|nr:four helix bundle protein [Candidatus Peregrinibacteria bacterium]
MSIVGSFNQLSVWKKAHELSLALYLLVNAFPTKERFCLTDQMCRAVTSIELNIAEGSGRKTKKDFIHFLVISRGSAREVLCLLLLSRDLGYINEEKYLKLADQTEEIIKMTNGLIRYLSQQL